MKTRLKVEPLISSLAAVEFPVEGPTANTRAYYPGDTYHLWQLLMKADETASSRINIMITIDSTFLHSPNVAEAYAILAAEIGKMVESPTFFFLATSPELIGSSDETEPLWDLIFGTLDGRLGGQFSLAIPSVHLRHLNLPSAFSLERIMKDRFDEVGERMAHPFEAAMAVMGLRSERARRETVLHFHSEESSLGTDIYHSADRLLESGVSVHADVECFIGNRGAVDVKELINCWKVTLTSSSSLPRWEDYDDIEHFMNYGWVDYLTFQEEAAESLWRIIYDCRPAEIHDVGCGSGEILSSLFSKLAESDINPSWHGCDPSERQVMRAKLLCDSCAELSVSGLDQVSCRSSKGSLVMLLGNTLAHIGAESFRDWLRDVSRRKPEFILFDFALKWRELLYQADPEIVCSPVEVSQAEGMTVYSHMSTAGGPGWVKRGVHLHFVADHDGEDAIAINSLQKGEHRLFTRQFADPPETYFKILHFMGYRSTLNPGIRYRSGWGLHHLYLFRHVSNESTFQWPRVVDDQDRELNEIWYTLLCKAWRGLADPVKVSDSYCFPVALLPFGQKQIYARYVPRNDDDLDSKYATMFDAWMWVVDPRDPMLKHEGAPKGEDVLPYAPSIYRAILSEAPSLILEHFDATQKELRIDSNAGDMELADLERNWLDPARLPEGLDLYYSLPVYLSGVPAYVILIRSHDRITQDFSATVGHLKFLRSQLLDSIGDLFEEQSWRTVVGEILARAHMDTPFVLGMFDRVREHPWKDILSVPLGKTLLENQTEASGSLEIVTSRHKRLVGEYVDHNDRQSKSELRRRGMSREDDKPGEVVQNFVFNQPVGAVVGQGTANQGNVDQRQAIAVDLGKLARELSRMREFAESSNETKALAEVEESVKGGLLSGLKGGLESVGEKVMDYAVRASANLVIRILNGEVLL